MSTTSQSGDLVLVLSTFPNTEEAGNAARTLVSECLCACVNIVPGVQSVYRWREEIISNGEVLCVIKTQRERHQELIARLGELHPYDVPEIVSFGADAVNEPYLQWVLGETKR
jgi:periplasmic divalent cation tolerance protein